MKQTESSYIDTARVSAPRSLTADWRRRLARPRYIVLCDGGGGGGGGGMLLAGDVRHSLAEAASQGVLHQSTDLVAVGLDTRGRFEQHYFDIIIILLTALLHF